MDVNYLNNWGRNALYYATINENGHGERIANLLKEKSATERENKPDAMVIMGVNPKIKVPYQIQLGASIPDKNGVIALLDIATKNAESTDVIGLLLNGETAGVGYCDIRERFFYPILNVCPVNSYSSLSNKKDE